MYYPQQHHFILGAGLIGVVLLVILAILAFEIWMLVDAATNHRISGEEKAIWIVGMLLLHPFVAIAYYFIARQGLPRKQG